MACSTTYMCVDGKIIIYAKSNMLPVTLYSLSYTQLFILCPNKVHVGEDDGIFLLLWSTIIRPERVKTYNILLYVTSRIYSCVRLLRGNAYWTFMQYNVYKLKINLAQIRHVKMLNTTQSLSTNSDGFPIKQMSTIE